jgi:hypothetical protein
MMNRHELTKAHEHTFKNRQEIVASRKCGCFYCRDTFEAASVTEWWDHGMTAVCPLCGIDSVIGDAAKFSVTAPGFLAEMHVFWFGRIRQ